MTCCSCRADRSCDRADQALSCGRRRRSAARLDGFELFGFASDGFPFANTPGQPPGLIDPVAQYDHDDGVATVGGFVYRGSRFP